MADDPIPQTLGPADGIPSVIAAGAPWPGSGSLDGWLASDEIALRRAAKCPER
ncbi:MAG: hypothetical protein AAGA93_11860 [Actinomycetota bacterium]